LLFEGDAIGERAVARGGHGSRPVAGQQLPAAGSSRLLVSQSHRPFDEAEAGAALPRRATKLGSSAGAGQNVRRSAPRSRHPDWDVLATYVSFGFRFITFLLVLWFLLRAKNWARWFGVAVAFPGNTVSAPHIVQRFQRQSVSWIVFRCLVESDGRMTTPSKRRLTASPTVESLLYAGLHEHSAADLASSCFLACLRAYPHHGALPNRSGLSIGVDADHPPAPK